MSTAEPLIRGVSDTARWVAWFRANETKRPDALFRDPYAEMLAGERGFEIARDLHDGDKHEWAWVARTYLFDRFISAAVENGADVVLNLAAGLDARPYRMQLPPGLQWIEIDLPEIINYKREILRSEKPVCQIERKALDLSDGRERQKLFAEESLRGRKVVVVTEGLLIYFSPEEVAAFAQDLASVPNFSNWIIDLASPGQLKLMQRTTGRQLREAGAAFQFAPVEGANFFAQYGWVLEQSRGLLKTAAELKRAPQELMTLLPEPKRIQGNYPWTGVCLLKRSGAV